MSVNILVRRSNLLVPITDAAALAASWRCNADAVTLDLESVPAADKPRTRTLVKDAIGIAGQAAAEVFVRIDKTFLHVDLDAAVWPGLTGIMLPRIDAPAELQEAADAVTALERSRGIAVGSLGFIVEIESARAVWNIRSILKASARVSQMGLNEARLAANLGFEPQDDLDPFEYARGRLVVEGIAASVVPIGMCYPLTVHPHEDDAAVLHTAAMKAKNLGMKGIVCHARGLGRACQSCVHADRGTRRLEQARARGVCSRCRGRHGGRAARRQDDRRARGRMGDRRAGDGRGVREAGCSETVSDGCCHPTP